MINNIGKIHGSSINGRSSIKIDSSNVDITGNLITKGKLTFTKPDEEIVSLSSSNGILNRFNNVVNIPATDSDGNDLSANTTYEITTGPVGNINNISFVKKNSRVYFSAQINLLETNISLIYLNEPQNAVPSGSLGAGDFFTTNGGSAEATWDTTTMVSSDTQTNFATQGYVVPRDGVYKIDCYQTIRGKDNNHPLSSLRVYRNPNVSTTASAHYLPATCLASTKEAEGNEFNPDIRSESLVWLGQLEANDRIKFMIRADNGARLNVAPTLELEKSCYTIVNVD